jgi:hypothetical protein
MLHYILRCSFVQNCRISCLGLLLLVRELIQLKLLNMQIREMAFVFEWRMSPKTIENNFKFEWSEQRINYHETDIKFEWSKGGSMTRDKSSMVRLFLFSRLLRARKESFIGVYPEFLLAFVLSMYRLCHAIQIIYR